MNNISTNNDIGRLEDLKPLDLSDKQIDILLEDKANTRSILHSAQECNQLRSLIRHLILSSYENTAEGVNKREETSDWLSKQWEERVQEAFMDRRRDLDQVSFWMLQTNEKGQALELYYQLCNEETTFEKLAAVFRGVKKEIKKPYNELHKVLQLQLRGAGTSKPQSPIRITTGYLVTKVIEQHPAELDAIMKDNLLCELKNEWADRQITLRLEELTRSKST